MTPIDERERARFFGALGGLEDEESLGDLLSSLGLTTPALSKGSTDKTSVSKLHSLLSNANVVAAMGKHSSSLVADQATKTFGTSTAIVVKQFQSKIGLPATGDVDKATWDALYSVSGQQKTGTQAASAATGFLTSFLASSQPATTTTAAYAPLDLSSSGSSDSSGSSTIYWVVGGIAVVGLIGGVAYYVRNRS